MLISIQKCLGQQMNLNDLNQITNFHDHLNPRLWHGDKLDRHVELHLLKIARVFVMYIGVENLELKDITISGSSCGYNYNDKSDIDLHLIADSDSACWPHLQEMYQAKKNLFNDEHDLRIRGMQVEVYVQDVKQKHISNGIYSIYRDQWLKYPEKITADVDQTNITHKYQDLKKHILQVISTGDPDQMERMQKRIKRMRQTGLEQQGEFGVENLVFKLLRRDGSMQKLWQAHIDAQDQMLSLDK
jgi:hypothetical protein